MTITAPHARRIDPVILHARLSLAPGTQARSRLSPSTQWFSQASRVFLCRCPVLSFRDASVRARGSDTALERSGRDIRNSGLATAPSAGSGPT